jgi:signal transduction histidine kinase
MGMHGEASPEGEFDIELGGVEMTPHFVTATAALDRVRVVGSSNDILALDEIAHDMRQPIVTIQVLVESCQAGPDLPPGLQWHVQKIAEEAMELSALVNRVLDPDACATAAVPVSDCVESVLETIRLTFSGRLLMTGAPAASLLIDPLALRRAVANLVVNATRAAGPGGTVHVTVLAPVGELCIRVDDDGPGFGGVEPGHLLGLGIVQKSIHGAGGQLCLGPSPTLGGARAEIQFPSHPSRTRRPGNASPAVR